ncbi:MAG: hypothetical protein ACKPKO_36025, partial [Candidatus Fonsibacter sp.]
FNDSIKDNDTLATKETPRHIIGKLFSKFKDTRYDLCQNDESIFLRSFKDKFEGNAWYDAYRCHDVHVLHWLVSFGYKSLVTDMSTPVSGSSLTYTRERMPLE